MVSGDGRVWEELSFLVPPGAVADWRLAVLYDAAAGAGLVDGLPGAPAELAERLGLDGRAVRVVLEALAVWGVVEAGDDGVYAAGAEAPAADAAAVLRHHARSLRLWSGHLDDRLRGAAAAPAPAAASAADPGQVELWLEALAVNGRESAPGTVDACLARVPEAHRVLDLGGGHGEYTLEFARRGLRAAMQDRPVVVDIARRQGRLAEAGVELFAGDFFEVLPDGEFDIVFCSGVAYTYDGERNTALYRQVRPLVAPGGSLALHTFLQGTDELASIFAVQMLGATGGGDTHAEDDYRRWLDAAGYSAVDAVRLDRRPESLVLASP